eukprot:c16613_g1_i1.p1 GENE.c16613_g1_i1~~c16613_g1_i1.p1  ORF type:complete len:393 (+),score=71.44 c16613_g1_i1:25-1179(+)
MCELPSYVSLLGLDPAAYRKQTQKDQQKQSLTVFTTQFSPDMKHLVCGDSLGIVTVWAVALLDTDMFSTENGQSVAKPPQLISFQAHTGSVYCLQFISSQSGWILVTGGSRDIRCWQWDSIISHIGATTVANISYLARLQNFPSESVPFVAETNAICLDPEIPSVIYSASGDGHIYKWDLATLHNSSTPTATFEGHLDSVHCIATSRHSRQLVSGSEDGNVRVWDIRGGGCTGVIDLASEGKSGFSSKRGYRLDSKSYVSCVTVEESGNWLICGGGGKVGLRMFHLSSLVESVNFNPTISPQTVLLYDHHVWCGGQGNTLQVFTNHGQVASNLSTSSSSVFGMCVGDLEGPGVIASRVVCVVGTSPWIDVFAAKSHKAFSIPVA